MKNIFKEVLITIVYYTVIYFVTISAFKAFPCNGGPSEAFFLMIGFGFLSLILFVYNFVKLMKGDEAKLGSIITHIISVFVLIKLLT